VRQFYETYRNEFDLKAELQRVCGVDLTSIDGIDVMTAQTVVAELGTDFSRWKDEAHLTSRLGLAPCRDISGGKVLKQATLRVKNRVRYCTPGSRQYSTAQRQLSRSPFPFPANPARST
jgi:transposase